MNLCAILLMLSNKINELFNKVKREEDTGYRYDTMFLENGRERDHLDCICIGIEIHTHTGDHFGIPIT